MIAANSGCLPSQPAGHRPAYVAFAVLTRDFNSAPVEATTLEYGRADSGSQNQAAGNHVVQRLLFFGDAGENVADVKRGLSRNDLSEKSTRSSAEADAIAVDVGDDEIHYLFADRGLPI